MSVVSVRNAVPVPLKRPDGRVIDSSFVSFHGLYSRKEHFAVRLGAVSPDRPPLVRIHSECATGDLFGSARCDCGPQLSEAIDIIDREGGYILYMRQEGRGIGLFAKLDAYELQNQGMDTYEANRYLGFEDDPRDFRESAMMLLALDTTKIRLLSNNPEKTRHLETNGVKVVEHLHTGVHSTAHNKGYLRAKAEQHKHTIDMSKIP